MSVAQTLSKLAGQPVEVTIRSEKAFTFSLEVVDKKATKAITNFFKGQGKLTVEEDEECGTFIYLDL